MLGLTESSLLGVRRRCGLAQVRRARQIELCRDFLSATEAVPIRTISTEVPDLGLARREANIVFFLPIRHFD
jgi:hypothetical protein